MSSPNVQLHDIAGHDALIEWFGHMPRFHDAELLEIAFPAKGKGLLRIHAWDMTDQVDADGYFDSDRHAVVTLALESVREVNCVDFDMVPGIIFDLEITAVGEHFRIEWSGSYGVHGFITARQLQITLEPGKPH